MSCTVSFIWFTEYFTSNISILPLSKSPFCSWLSRLWTQLPFFSRSRNYYFFFTSFTLLSASSLKTLLIHISKLLNPSLNTFQFPVFWDLVIKKLKISLRSRCLTLSYLFPFPCVAVCTCISSDWSLPALFRDLSDELVFEDSIPSSQREEDTLFSLSLLSFALSLSAAPALP